MKLTEHMTDMIMNAEAKALGTLTLNSLNVVPVSTIKIIEDKIILVNYFMGKTLKNIERNPHVSLSCWKGLEGYQFKADAQHLTDGPLFQEIQNWVAEILPDRVVKGIILLSPHEAYDISATADTPGAQVA